MPATTSEAAVLKLGGLYDLILVASRRVRELRRGDAAQVDRQGDGDMVVAIREIEKGLVKKDYLLKNPEVEITKKRKTHEARSELSDESCC